MDKTASNVCDVRGAHAGSEECIPLITANSTARSRDESGTPGTSSSRGAYTHASSLSEGLDQMSSLDPIAFQEQQSIDACTRSHPTPSSPVPSDAFGGRLPLWAVLKPSWAA